MSNNSILEKFKNFAPITQQELEKAIKQGNSEEEKFWKKLAERENKIK